MKKILILLICILVVLVTCLVSLLAFEWYSEHHQSFGGEQYEIAVGSHDFTWGYFNWRSGIPSEPEVRVEYMMPVNFNAKSSDIVFYAPYGNAKDSLVRHHLYPLVSEHNMLLFTVAFSYEVQKTLPSSMQRVNHTSGWFEEIFKIQRELEKRFGMPRRKLLVIGDSAGAKMGQQMSSLTPDRIEAATWASAGGIVPYTAEPHPPVLAFSTWGDSGLYASLEMASTDRALGGYSLFAVSPPSWPEKGYKSFHHGANDLAYAMMRSFLAGVAEQRRANNGESMPPERWQYRITTFDGVEVPAPSAHFKALWEAYPAEEVHALMLAEEGGSNAPLTLQLPASEPDRIVLYTQSPSWRAELWRLDNLFFFAETGAFVITGAADGDIAEAWDIARGVPDLPIYMIVGGDIDQPIVEFVESIAPKELARLKHITFMNPAPENIEKLSRLPNALVVTNDEEFKQTEAGNIIHRVEAGDSFGRFYFKVLEELLDLVPGRNE